MLMGEFGNACSTTTRGGCRRAAAGLSADSGVSGDVVPQRSAEFGFVVQVVDRVTSESYAGRQLVQSKQFDGVGVLRGERADRLACPKGTSCPFGRIGGIAQVDE